MLGWKRFAKPSRDARGSYPSGDQIGLGIRLETRKRNLRTQSVLLDSSNISLASNSEEEALLKGHLNSNEITCIEETTVLVEKCH